MRASEIMTKDVATVPPDMTVKEIARFMADRHISGVPVLSPNQGVLGMVSEADLLRRVELDTDPRPARWADSYANPNQMAQAFIKAHGTKAHDIMTRPVVSVEHDATLDSVASTLDQHGVKRVPVIQAGKLVGIISRSDLVRAFGQLHTGKGGEARLSNGLIHKAVTDSMNGKPWLDTGYINLTVTDGVVRVSGYVQSRDHRDAMRILIEEVPGVERVEQDVEVGMPTLSWDGQLIRKHMLN